MTPMTTQTETQTLTVDVVDTAGKKAGTADLPGDVFDAQTNIPLIHQVVVAQLAAARQGTHDTKTRGEVRGGGKKPYKQKGTGRARQGSTRAPQFAGGGVVHGPTPRDYSQRTPKKMKAAALRGALSDRARAGRVHVVTGFGVNEAPSTKAAVAVLDQLSGRKHVLVVVERADELAWKSLRNVERVHLLVADQLNTYDVLVSDDVVFTQGALDTFLAGPAKGRGATAVATSSEVEEDTK
jgi:large subunit ribosomal protein L4